MKFVFHAVLVCVFKASKQQTILDIKIRIVMNNDFLRNENAGCFVIKIETMFSMQGIRDAT